MKIFCRMVSLFVFLFCLINCGTNQTKDIPNVHDTPKNQTKSTLNVNDTTDYLTELPELHELPDFIHVAGYYYEDGIHKACFWKGKERIDLPIPTESTESGVYAITIDNGTVYTAGYYFVPLNWKGLGTITPSMSTSMNFTISTNVSANTMAYPALSVRRGIYKACYWKDTTRIDLPVPEGSEDSWATDIGIINGTIYTVGRYYNHGQKPCYWKDTTRIDLPVPKISGYYESGYSGLIAIDNRKIYIAGSYNEGRVTKPCYWVDSLRIDLSLSLIEPDTMYSLILL